jgi:hypothetical protein
MGLFLHFGAGPNQLAEPWQNLSAEHDIRRPLKFADGSASACFAEHVIEHVSFASGFSFLSECRRVLEPGGALRLGFPDVGRFLVYGDDGPELGQVAADYASALIARGVVTPSPHSLPPELEHVAMGRAAVRLLLTGWDHQSAWTVPLAAGVLLALGFKDVRRYDYGQGPLGHCDGHAKDNGELVATLESTYFEAKK